MPPASPTPSPRVTWPCSRGRSASRLAPPARGSPARSTICAASVADAEAKVEQYRSKTNLFIGNNNTTLSNQQLGDLSTHIRAARAQRADAEAKAKIIRDTLRSGAPVEFSDIINSELMRRLSEQRVTLRAQLAEQSSTLLDGHPRIKELRAQINDLERQMRAEAERLARSLDNDSRLANARVDALGANLDPAKRQTSSTNEQDVQLRALERDAKSQRDLLESYLAKYREASARDNIGAASPEARIISTAACRARPPGRRNCRRCWSRRWHVCTVVGLRPHRRAVQRCPRRPAVIREFRRHPWRRPVAAPAVAPVAETARGDATGCYEPAVRP